MGGKGVSGASIGCKGGLGGDLAGFWRGKGRTEVFKGLKEGLGGENGVNRASKRQKECLGEERGGTGEGTRGCGRFLLHRKALQLGVLGSKWRNRRQGSGRRARGDTGDSNSQKKASGGGGEDWVPELSQDDRRNASLPLPLPVPLPSEHRDVGRCLGTLGTVPPACGAARSFRPLHHPPVRPALPLSLAHFSVTSLRY